MKQVDRKFTTQGPYRVVCDQMCGVNLSDPVGHPFPNPGYVQLSHRPPGNLFEWKVYQPHETAEGTFRAVVQHDSLVPVCIHPDAPIIEGSSSPRACSPYIEAGNFVVAPNEREAITRYKHVKGRRAIGNL